jgi:tetratricopeptide (TPR) repeat protein
MVRLADGSEPPDRVVIERLCSTNNVRIEGYTDSKGRFGVQLGGSQQLLPDASSTMFIEAVQGFPTGTRSTTQSSAVAADPNFDCELRAKLPGYISSTFLLAGRKPMENPDIGILVLTPMAKTEGKAVTATSASASKDARKAFDKGVSDAKKQKYDQAETELRTAVELHPKYADAWLQLGKVYQARKQNTEARDAFTHAIAADPNYVYPYEQLYQVAFEQAQWQELADTTEKLLRLNPYEFPGAYYYNGVAHYQLRNWDAAEKSLNQAIKMDLRNVNPKTRYVLGLVLVQKKQYSQAAENLNLFTTIAPNDPQVAKARSLVNEIAKLGQ